MKKRKGINLLQKGISALLAGMVIFTMSGTPVLAENSSDLQDADQLESCSVPSKEEVNSYTGEQESDEASDSDADYETDISMIEDTDGFFSSADVQDDTMTEEEISAAAAGEEEAVVTVGDPDPATGKFTVRISGISLEAEEQLIVPVWGTTDQSDIVWYTAEKDGTDYIVQADPAGHAYSTGTYNIHVYLRDTAMNMHLLAQTSQQLMPAADTLNAEVSGDSMVVTLEGLKEYGVVSSVRYAVWTAENGQDDLVWYKAARSADGSWEREIPLEEHAGTGTCLVHAYALTGAGKMVFLQSAAAEVSGPSIQEIKVSDADPDTGDFTVTVSGIQAPSGLNAVIVPIWSKEDQSDLVWYTAIREGDSYVVRSNISKHSWHTGTYQVHVYLQNTKGKMQLLGMTSMEASVSADSVASVMEEGSSTASVSVEGLKSCGSFSKIRVAAWSEKNGQDDLEWFSWKNLTNGNFSSTIPMSDHSDSGICHVHFYMEGKDGSMTFLGAVDMEVQENSVQNYSVETSGKSFTIRAEGVCCGTGISAIQIPVWNKADQSDIVWYTAVREEGTDNWVVKSDISKHRNHTGTYHAHLYVRDNSGKMFLLGQKDFQISAAGVNSLEITDADGTAGSFNVQVTTGAIDTDISEVKVAIWSQADQSDIKWYDAEQTGEDVYAVMMDVRNHQEHFGIYYVHAYAFDSEGTGTLIATETTQLKAENYVYTTRITDGKYKITVCGPKLNNTAAVSVYVPTWSDTGGQDDILWYQADEDADGDYSVIVDRTKHAHDGSFTSDIYVKDAAGNMSMIKRVNYTLTSEVQEFSDYAKEVMHNIIYAVETGGQVYGNKRYDCFLQAYTNSSNEKAITIGAGCWYGTEAKHLLSLIRSEYPDTFEQYDTAGIGSDLDSQDWTTYGGDGAGGRTILSGSEKALAIQAIINSAGGRAIQDRLVDEQMTTYVNRAEALGVTDLKARMFCANIHHLGGYSAMKRIINYCINDGLELTMDNLWADMRAHESGAGNKVGSDLYATRHQKVMQWLNMYIG